MSEKPFFFSRNFTVYLTDANRKIIEENYELAFQTDEDLKPAIAFMKLFEAACDTQRNKIDHKKLQELTQRVPELETQLKEKDDQIARLQQELSQLKETHDQEIQVMTSRLQLLQNEVNNQGENQNMVADLNLIIADLKSENATLKSKAPLPPGAVLVILKPSEEKVIDHICQQETNRTGKEVTADTLLKNVFFFILVNGPHDVFAAPVSIKKIQELTS
jgi:predicted RNase H-like nuclease (RuvC/YqgF family)